MTVEADARRDLQDRLALEGTLTYDMLSADERRALPGLIRDGVVVEFEPLIFRAAPRRHLVKEVGA